MYIFYSIPSTSLGSIWLKTHIEHTFKTQETLIEHTIWITLQTYKPQKKKSNASKRSSPNLIRL